MKKFAFLLAVGAAAAVAACSNGNDTGGSCSQPQGPLPVLLYPAPNSSGITPALQYIAVYRLGGAGGYVNLVPTATGAPVLTGAQFTPAPGISLPSPSASAPPGSIVNTSAVTPPLISGDTYNVVFVHNKQPPCGPQQPSGSIGQFTVAGP